MAGRHTACSCGDMVRLGRLRCWGADTAQQAKPFLRHAKGTLWLVLFNAVMLCSVIFYKGPAWSHINEVPQSWSGLYTARDMGCSHTAQIYRR